MLPGLLLLHHAEGVITPHEVGASRVGGFSPSHVRSRVTLRGLC